MKPVKISEEKCCLTCVYRKFYPPSIRDNQPVFYRFLCGLSQDSQKELVRPDEVCDCWRGASPVN